MISSHCSVRTIFSHDTLLAVLSSVLHLLQSTSDLQHTLFHKCQHKKLSPFRFHKLSPVPTFQTISPLTQSETKKCVARPLHLVLLPRVCFCLCFLLLCFVVVVLFLFGGGELLCVCMCVLGTPRPHPHPPSMICTLHLVVLVYTKEVFWGVQTSNQSSSHSHASSLITKEQQKNIGL